MAIESVLGIAAIPAGAIGAIVIIFIAWKIFKFAIQKIFAVLQGLTALALLGYAFVASGAGQFDPRIGLGIAGIAILFGAISSIFA